MIKSNVESPRSISTQCIGHGAVLKKDKTEEKGDQGGQKKKRRKLDFGKEHQLPSSKDEEANYEELCPICLDAMSKFASVKLVRGNKNEGCEHEFHDVCIRGWKKVVDERNGTGIRDPNMNASCKCPVCNRTTTVVALYM